MFLLICIFLCCAAAVEEESDESFQGVIPVGGRGLSTMTRPTT